jgi:hypothetical protein
VSRTLWVEADNLLHALLHHLLQAHDVLRHRHGRRVQEVWVHDSDDASGGRRALGRGPRRAPPGATQAHVCVVQGRLTCRVRQVSLSRRPLLFARRPVFASHSRHAGAGVWMLISACWQHSFCFPLSSRGACSHEHKRGLSSIASLSSVKSSVPVCQCPV